MKLKDLQRRLGTTNKIEFASSTCNKLDVFRKILESIQKAGVDVDAKYLDYIASLDPETIKYEIKYVPVYYTTTIAKLTWKEVDKQGKSDDHNEFVRFNSIMYFGQHDKSERINKLNILKMFSKESIKLNEMPSDNTKLLETHHDSDLLLPSSGYEATEVLEVSLDEGDYYQLDNRFILSQSDINNNVLKDLEKTKSYKRIKKQAEKWTSIEQIDINVVLVPIASVYLGSKIELVNCANGEIDISYELNPLVTDEVKKAKYIALPAIVISGLLNLIILCMFLFTSSGPVIFNKDTSYWLPFKSFNGYIWIILLIISVGISIIALPNREAIVERIKNNKNPLHKCKILSNILYSIDFGVFILLLTIIQYVGGK